MSPLVAMIRRYPLASVAVGLLIAVGLWFGVTGRPGPSPQQVGTPPAPVRVTPAPAPPPVVEPAPPPPEAPTVPPPAPLPAAGRQDPFAPLVRPATPAPAVREVAPLPPIPLPPPIFPGQEPPLAPLQPAVPVAPPKLAAGAEVIGLLSDSGGVAIVRLGGTTFVVGVGDVIENRVRVERIDAKRGVLVLIEDGERFELFIGEVNPTDVVDQDSQRSA